MEKWKDIKELYGKKFLANNNDIIYTIKRKGSKNSYVTWVYKDGDNGSSEHSNESILAYFNSGIWKLIDSEIDKYYDSLFYVIDKSEVLYKIHKENNDSCYVTLLNAKKSTAYKGTHSNEDILNNFKAGIWILYNIDDEVKEDLYTHYEVPYDMFNGAVKKNDWYEIYTNEFGDSYGRPVNINKYILPKEVVMRWDFRTNIKPSNKAVNKKDLKVGDWVVVLNEDDDYYNCEQKKAQKVVGLDEGLNNDYIKLSFSDINIRSKYYTKVRRATKEEIIKVSDIEQDKTEIELNIFTVINSICITK